MLIQLVVPEESCEEWRECHGSPTSMVEARVDVIHALGGGESEVPEGFSVKRVGTAVQALPVSLCAYETHTCSWPWYTMG